MNSGAYATKGDNWVKFTNGLLVQWGNIDHGSEVSDFSKVITFPQPFTNINYTITAQDFRTTTSGANRDSYTSVWNKKTTGCTLGHYQNKYRYIGWMAVGY